MTALIIAEQIEKGYKPYWTIMKIMDEPNVAIEDFEQLAELFKYKKGWAFFKHRDYINRWKLIQMIKDDHGINMLTQVYQKLEIDQDEFLELYLKYGVQLN